MKSCKRFHIEDVEPGDIIMLHRDETKPVIVTVRRTFSTNHFGWGIDGTNDSTYYWDDWDYAECMS